MFGYETNVVLDSKESRVTLKKKSFIAKWFVHDGINDREVVREKKKKKKSGVNAWKCREKRKSDPNARKVVGRVVERTKSIVYKFQLDGQWQ